jgi:hyaluronan synthase
MKYKRPSAHLSQPIYLVGLVFIIAALSAWAVRHALSVIDNLTGKSNINLEYIYALAFIMLIWTTALAMLDKPKKVTRHQQSKLNKLNLVVSVPLYNEDPVFLKRCIHSIISQSRKPSHIYVVDDGSTESKYIVEKKWAYKKSKEAGIKITWRRTSNGGKRHAQYVAIKATPNADIYLTVDSDGILDREAIKEGLKPFANQEVQSVAGVVVAINNRKNLLTRFTDLWFVTGQLIDRSSMSTMGSVLVNSGVLAFYRGDLLRENADAYINETFFGKRVEFSDDSMLTIYALAKGKAVQQTSSIAFTAMPENINHHLRQYLRWMRGAFIRTWWRLKYLPLSGYGYWAHLVSWVQMAVSSVIFLTLFVLDPISKGVVVPSLILIPILVGYGQAVRYLTIRRSDESIWSQLFTVVISPVATLWAFSVLRVVRWYAIATCTKMGWGTRSEIEVTA